MKLNEFFEYMDQEPVSKSPAADKIAQVAASYGKDDMDYDDLVKAAELLRAGKLKTLGKFVYDLDTDPRELIMSIINDVEPDTFKKMYGDQTGYMSLMNPQGVDEDEGSDKEKWLRYAKFWKYIRDIMAQEADADIADGFISADNIDEEPSYVTAKAMMKKAMASQNTPWNDAIINRDLSEYKTEISDNDDYTEKTNFGKMKKAAMEMITTGTTQIVPYRGYPPMDQMDYSAEDTTDEDINDIVRLSGIK